MTRRQHHERGGHGGAREGHLGPGPAGVPLGGGGERGHAGGESQLRPRSLQCRAGHRTLPGGVHHRRHAVQQVPQVRGQHLAGLHHHLHAGARRAHSAGADVHPQGPGSGPAPGPLPAPAADGPGHQVGQVGPR